MRFSVRFTPDAEDDLLRMFDFLLERDLAAAARAERAIRRALRLLEFSPFSCRKAGSDPLLRELVIPFGSAGYVALFRIDNARSITILAVRHQRESDYH